MVLALVIDLELDPDSSGIWQQATEVKPGTSLFAWANNDSTVLMGSGAANGSSITITLVPGWNLIANQRAIAMTDIGTNWLVDGTTPLSSAITSNIIGGSIYEWEGSTNDSWSIALDNPEVEPWQGHWILNMDNVSHTLTMQ